MKARSIAAFAFGPVVAAGLGLATVPAMAWAFAPQDLGRYNVFTVTTAFAVILLCLGLDQAYVREYHETSDTAALMRACFKPVLLVATPVLGLAVVFSATLAKLLFASAGRIYTLLLVAAIVVSVIGRFLSLILRMQERGVAYSLSQVIPKALVLGAIVVIALTELEASFLVLASVSVVSLSSILMVYAWNTRAHWTSSRAGPEVPSTGRLLRYGVPLMAAGIAYWGLTSTSVVSLRAFSSFAELGVYAVAVSAAGIVFTMQSVFSTIWAPIVFRWANEGQARMRVPEVARLGGFVASALAASIGMFSWLIPYILPSAYASIANIVVCAVFPPILYALAEVTGIGVNLERRTGLSLVATAVAFASNIAMCAVLVPYLDAVGAAVANALAFAIYFVVLTEASCRVWLATSRLKLYVSLGAVLVLACVHAVAGDEFGHALPGAWALMLAAIVVAWPNERSLVMASLRRPRSMLGR